MRRAVLLCHGRHVDDGCRRGAEGDPAESGSDHAGFVIAPHEAEDHKIRIGDRQQNLQGQRTQNEQQRAAELPKLKPHQGHGQKHAQADIGDQ
ncbi:hypothetical protein D3C76_1387850 [compost metagenome]